ncbi:MAG: DUF3500 domain-containing protein [bacterium]|nr:DUF3500 domain-containing protein [bacterium]
MPPSRRQLLAGTAGLAASGLFGVASRGLLPPKPSAELAPVDDLARALSGRLRARGVDDAFVDYDHPRRQFHNRGVASGGTKTVFLRRQEQALLVDLIHASLSPAGRTRLFDQFFLGLVGLNYGRLLFVGDPEAGPYQVHLTGAHLNLRMGGANREGDPFGGPQVYGDQTGDGEVGLPGNAYLDQLEAGQALIASLSPAARKQARRPKAPVQTAVAVQGTDGHFEGVPVGELTTTQRAAARAVIDRILGNYAEGDRDYAWACIEANGGIETFHLADYDVDHQEGMRFDDQPSPIFRLESPAAVFHFRAAPHLHAFLNVARDGEAPLSVGEVVANAPERIDTMGMRRLFETVLREETGLDLAYYPSRAVAGHFRAGPIRTGDVWSAESWEDRVAIVEIHPRDVAPEAVQDGSRTSRRMGSSETIEATRRVAMPTGVAAWHESYGIEQLRVVEEGRWLREAVIDRLRARGLSGTAPS